tara:strand:- start:311 stop:562 length:252 start_codon:yes stop_codon:yes gene_type:complete
MAEKKFNIGDLVFYSPSTNNKYADGTRQLGVVLKIKTDVNPLFSKNPETQAFAHEYVVKWFESGYISALLGFNLKKLEIPLDK